MSEPTFAWPGEPFAEEYEEFSTVPGQPKWSHRVGVMPDGDGLDLFVNDESAYLSPLDALALIRRLVRFVAENGIPVSLDTTKEEA